MKNHIPEIFILQNLILCTRSCGTGFITQSSWVFYFQLTTLIILKSFVLQLYSPSVVDEIRNAESNGYRNLNGGEILANWSKSRKSNFSVSHGTQPNYDFDRFEFQDMLRYKFKLNFLFNLSLPFSRDFVTAERKRRGQGGVM